MNQMLDTRTAALLSFEESVSKLRAGLESGTLSPLIVGSGLEHLLKGHAFKREFPVWKTVQYLCPQGTHTGFAPRTSESYLHALREIECQIQGGPLKSMIFFAFGFPEQLETEADLALVTPSELGFTGRVARRRVIARAIELGLKLCLQQTAPALRLAYLDQPCGEWVVVVSEPLMGQLLRVGRGTDGLWLGSIYTDHDQNTWGPNQLLAFEIPRTNVN